MNTENDQRIPIDHGMPIPNERVKYPFASMAVGDSFAVPENKSRYARSGASTFGKKHGRTFTSRKEEGKDTIRIWRVT